ncbi:MULTISPECIES: type IV pilin protein [Pseudoalteromonas]|uniref:Type IV pilin n=1 Tax=Pseudoalteromonas amylolytica TaxID=1859457 RepID=A0A1S1MT89_9GAMM|nr:MULTISPECIES: type IV pilin protein [Pseudoalteromonas]OHU86167.1 type IV pilin [Pseudoalteromonas sp. JW3]OHU89726.1 type IV pilin [Pseudoalteromonas amylolytica]
MVSKGFSLTELLIAAAIVAILGAVAYPTYIESMQESRRSQAQQEMLQVAIILERSYSRNGGYPDSDTFTALPVLEMYTFKYEHLNKPENGENYTSRSYLLTATPKTGTLQESDPCGAITLNHIGTQGAEVDDCW